MKIVNNKITIARGETPTYEVGVIDKDTGAPFMIVGKYVGDEFFGIYNPIVVFSVKPSVYSLDDDYAFKVYMEYNNEPKFSSTDILSYNDLDPNIVKMWDNNIVPPESKQAITREGKITNACLYGLTKDDVTEYRYYDPNAELPEELPEGVTENNYKWVPYEFRISFNFPYSNGFDEETKKGFGGTSDLEIKTYKYDVTFFDATLVEVEGEYKLTNISYKKPLIDVNDFIVGGSTSE